MKSGISAEVASLTILRLGQVIRCTGLSRSTIYSKLRPNPKRPKLFDPTFPQPVRLGRRAIGFFQNEIEYWLKSRAANDASGAKS